MIRSSIRSTGLSAGTYIFSANTTGSDYLNVRDTRLRMIDPTSNFGTNASLEVDRFTEGSDQNSSLIAFDDLDLAALNGTTITSATLTLWVNASSGANFVPEVHMVRRTWNVAQASWNVYTTGNSWTTAGALDTTNDIFPTNVNSNTASITAGGYNFVISGAAFTAAVQAMIDGTESAANGFHIYKGSVSAGEYCGMTSSDGTDGQRPKLTIVV